MLACLAFIIVLLGAGAEAADAREVQNALAIPCQSSSGSDLQRCSGNLATRVDSFDGVPLDIDVTLPPASVDGPYPTIFYMHGFGSNKSLVPGVFNVDDYARRGYAVVAYSARGLGNSCGVLASRADPGCTEGWIHLADARYEVHDTQYLAGLLADEGLAKPRRIGVAGESYGGGQSYMLATLRDRIMTRGGDLRAWRSPDGKRMRIAAAAPRIGWTDLAYALAPNGGTLDFRARNPYGDRFGILKFSYINALYAAGLSGYYAPPGVDPSADITNWYQRVLEGEPYDTPDVREIKRQITRFRSAYYVFGREPKRPAPILAYNGWTDDIMPANEPIRYANRVRERYPHAEFSILLADAFAHPRGSLAAVEQTPGLVEGTEEFFDRHLMGERGKPLGVATYTQNCGASKQSGPFVSESWQDQARGDVRLREPRDQLVRSSAANAAKAAQVDPFGGPSACRTVPDSDDPGTAVYRLAKVSSGYTMIGSPTVSAKLRIDGEFPQLAARLWDVAPDGTQAFVTHGLLRPDPDGGRQTFQLFPNGWQFREGHVPKLELLGQDSPYARPSNGSGFTVDVKSLRLSLPVRERSAGGGGERDSGRGFSRSRPARGH